MSPRSTCFSCASLACAEILPPLVQERAVGAEYGILFRQVGVADALANGIIECFVAPDEIFVCLAFRVAAKDLKVAGTAFIFLSYLFCSLLLSCTFIKLVRIQNLQSLI